MRIEEEGMVSKVFIDANILLDLVLQRNGYQAAKELYHYIEIGKVNGYISPSIVHLVAYWIKKTLGVEAVKPFLLELCDHIEVVDAGHVITINALRSEITDVEYALQYCAAIAHEMEIFVSNDRYLKKIATLSLPVLDSDEFVRTLKFQ